ncbi:MAG: hypothetical protein HP496_06150 [Nitrospira sp.]|nr:hypothetical protein [Nitrospira sp.]
MLHNASICSIPPLPTIPEVVARVGVADVRAFGLTWDDCEQLLSQLGYSAQVSIVAGTTESVDK